jgi:hypothetical protein
LPSGNGLVSFQEIALNLRTATRIAFAFLAGLILCASAHAQVFRAYVASDGNDANPCSLLQPCRLLPAALNAVASGGEIWMLDSANYNTETVTIGKSVSILAVPGAVGSVVAVGGPAISITASSLKVALRNVVIVPLPSSGATNGVELTGASTLFIENSLIANLPSGGGGVGVYVLGTGKVKIANSIIRNNAYYAVWLQDGASAEISGTQMLVNVYGGVLALSTQAANPTMASLTDSIVSGGTHGVFANSSVAGAVAKIFVTRCTIEGVANALDSETPGVGVAIVAVSGSMVINNTSAWFQLGTGSVIRTLGNNHITDNTGSTGSLTLTPMQ